MKRVDGIHAHDQEADLYDEQVREYESYAHDLLFGMTFEYVRPGDRLLDLGIGTGLASLPFAKVGLEVFGLDGSAEMLRVCKSKGFAKELKCLDFRETPLPYSDCFFSHVICCGVFHFLDDLAPILSEVSHVTARDGIFTFTVAAPPDEKGQIAGSDMDGCGEIDTEWGVSICTHSYEYVTALLRSQGFEMLKRQKFLMRGGVEDEGDLLFAAYVARKC